MANTEFNVRIQLKRDTDANWRAKDPRLLAGEVVFVDTNAGEVRTKVGDGTKKYSALPFMDEVLRNLISTSEHLFKVKAVCDLTGDTTTPTISEHGDIGEILSVAIDQTQPIVAEVENEYDKLWLPLVYFNPDKEEASFIGPLNSASAWFTLGFKNGEWSSGRIDLAKLTDIPTKLSQLENDTNYLNSDTNFVHKTDDELIKGIKTFESSIVCSMTPGNENHLVNKKYVDNKIPTTLKNPYALTVKGAISATYDGSKAISITIPDPGISETQADGKYLQLSGGTLAGELTVYTSLTIINGDALSETIIKAGADGLPTLDLAITPVSEYALVQKHYVDTCIEAKANVVLKTWTSADVS